MVNSILFLVSWVKDSISRTTISWYRRS
jgi:hypothetical protein